MKPEGVEYPAFKNDENNTVPIQFGAQMKYYAPNSISWREPFFMRSDEALLSAAEAYFHLGDEAKAKDFINQLNIMRNPSYFRLHRVRNCLPKSARPVRLSYGAKVTAGSTRNAGLSLLPVVTG